MPEAERGPTGDHGQDGRDGAIGEQGEKGDRGASSWIPWIAATLSMVIVAIVLGHVTRENRKAIRQLQDTKANVTQLQTSNCVLKKALLDARIKAYHRRRKEGDTVKEATTAVATLTTIIVGMDGQKYCPIPKKYTLPKENPNA